MKTIYFKSVLVAAFFMLVNSLAISQTIYSTSAGGPWDSTWAWIGGSVPMSYNDVVINGPIYTSNASCHNLTIGSSGALYNNYYSYTLTVTGDVENNGSISNYANYLSLNVGGDIINNGTWNNSYTYLTGSGYHHITCQNNHSFSGYQFQNTGTGNMFINTEAYFNNVRIYMNNLDLTIASNAMLKIHNGFLQQCNVIGSGSTSVVFGEGAVGNDSPYYTSVSFTDIRFQGVNDINNNCSTHGNIINEGFMQNDYYSYTLSIYDNFTNNGTIQNYSNYFTLNLYGDFVNNGSLVNSAINLYSDTDQQLTELNGHSFNTTYFTSNKASGKTIVLTDIDFLNCVVNMQNDTLIVPDNGTLKFVGSQFHNAVLYATPSMNGNLKLDMDENSYINNCHVYNPEILNKVKARNNHFYGDILVTDTLENDYYNYTVDIHGDIVNNGVIKNYSNNLYLNIEGDIVNNGVWNNNSISLTGTGDQHFTCTNGNRFSGYEFIDNNASGDIYADNQVYFDNVRVTFNNHNLMLPANSMLKIHNAYLYLCNLVGSGSTSVVFGEGAVGNDSPYYQNVSFNDLSFQGVNDINSNCSLHGTVVNDGVLQNDYYSYHLQVYDDFTNNGTIQNYSNAFYIDLYGNFTNNGILTNHELGLFSDTDQILTELNGNLFQTAFFTSYKPSGKTIMATDADFLNCVINMDYDTLILQDGGKISVVGGYMKNTVLLAPDTKNGNLKLEMGQNAMLQNCRVFNPEFLGRVKLENNNFYGNVIVTDTIENNYYNYTDSIHGDIVNNGIIRNYANSLTLNIEGNLVNNGVWGNSYTNMCGTADQHFSCLNGNKFSGYSFTSTNTTANLIVDDMVYFDNVQVGFNNNSLVIPENSTVKIHGQWLYQCNVTGAGESSVIYGEGIDISNSPYIQSVSLSNLTLSGSLRFDSGCSFYGNIVNNGTIVNNYYNFTVDVYGDLFNNGNINNWANSFSLNLYANITNNGGWSNSHTYMTGTTEQYVHLQDGNYYTGQMHFVSDIQTEPYQWYWDGWAIVNPPYPNPAIFYGETQATLTFLNPVDNTRTGTYYCSTGGGNSRNIIVDEITSSRLDIHAILEGSFDGNNISTTLNANGLIPLFQPYSGSPWNYNGPESVISIPADVVDWVLIELRDAPTASQAGSGTVVERVAGFLRNDGMLVGLDGVSPVTFNSTITNNLFVVVYHRNHLPVMNANPVPLVNGYYYYDFTTSGQAYNNGEKNVNGTYVMYGGDANANGSVDVGDATVWYSEVGASGYLPSDANLDGQSDNRDKNDIWVENNGTGSTVPN